MPDQLMTQRFDHGSNLRHVATGRHEKKCGSPCTREKLVDVLNDISVQTAGIYPDPVKWTKDDHTRPASFTAYAWDPKTNSVKRIADWARVSAGTLATVKVLD